MKIVFLTNSDRPNFSSRIQHVLKAYCERYQYTLLSFDRNFATDRHISWSKIPILQNAINDYPDYDYYVWVDDDILITNDNVDFSTFIQKYGFDTADDKHIMFSEDVCDECPINAGMMVVKKEAYDIFERIWDLADPLRKAYETNWEQDAIIHLLQNDTCVRERTMIIPHRTIQSFYRDALVPLELHWARGDFAAHITGMEMRKRMSILDKLLGDAGGAAI